MVDAGRCVAGCGGRHASPGILAGGFPGFRRIRFPLDAEKPSRARPPCPAMQRESGRRRQRWIRTEGLAVRALGCGGEERHPRW